MRRGGSLLRCLVALTVASISVLLVPSIARAGIAASAGPTFPTAVTVGQTGVAASIAVTNQNTTPNTADVNTVCNFGDPAPCPGGDPGITLIPSCGVLGSFSVCAPTGADPNVVQVAPTGVGDVGTECAGMVFDITLIDPAFGQLRFTPQGGAHVTLTGTGAICRINFVFDVLKVPVIDQDPGTAGVQTVQIVDNTQRSGVLTASARGTSTGMTVSKASPAITTIASPNVPVGSPITDSATVTGRVNPVAGATVTFNLYGNGDTTCGSAPVFTSTVAINADGTATSAAFTPSGPGTFRWIATYNGDANNNPVGGTCSDANESVTISRASPAITTVASPNVPVGSPITDSATVTGRVNPVAGATVTFNLYGNGDTTCGSAPVFTSTVAINADGTATSAGFTPSGPGTFRWIATYNGDANNNPVGGTCSDANESVTVTAARANPTITTNASPTIELKGAITDSATVTGRVNPVAGATVTFNLYGNGDTTCGSPPVFTSTVAINADGTATSAAFTPTGPGTFRWIATYNGDANNNPVSGTCNDANESVTITAIPLAPLLPATGSSIALPASVGAVLVAVGIGLLVFARRRRTDAARA